MFEPSCGQAIREQEESLLAPQGPPPSQHQPQIVPAGGAPRIARSCHSSTTTTNVVYTHVVDPSATTTEADPLPERYDSNELLEAYNQGMRKNRNGGSGVEPPAAMVVAAFNKQQQRRKTLREMSEAAAEADDALEDIDGGGCSGS